MRHATGHPRSRWLAVFASLFLPALARAAEIPLQVGEEADEQRFLRLTAAIEDEPEADNVRDVRTWLVDWAIAAPDITVTVCNTLGPAFDTAQTPAAPMFVAQLMFGNASFQIAHPERRDDEIAIQTAALESVLRLYDTLVTTDPGAKVPYLDNLLASHAAGTFAATVETIIVANCPKASAGPDDQR